MKYLPINFHILYILGTMLFSFFGPKLYKDYNQGIVFFFILIYLIAVFLGFRNGFKAPVKVYSNRVLKEDKLVRIFKIAIVAAIILFFMNLFYQFFTGRVSLTSSVGENYRGFYKYYNEKKEASLFTFEILFLVLAAIPKFLSLVLGFFYFKKLSKTYQTIFISFILLIVFSQTLLLGNQKSIGDVVIFFSVILLVKAMKMNKTDRFKLLRKTTSILLILFVFLSYSQYSRLDSRGISAIDINDHVASYSYFDLDHPIFKVFGYKVGFGITVFVTGYLTNGYYGLSKCLEMPFEWTYGVGNSVALSNIVEKSTGVEIYSKSYLSRMEETYNIPGKKHWHTIFPWIASDFSFYFIPFIFYGIAYYYGKSWKEVILFNNPVSLLLFALLTVMFVFVPANNQIMHGFDYIMITFLIVYLWSKHHVLFNSTYLSGEK